MSAGTRLEVRNIDAGLIRRYLVDEMAGVPDGDLVRGDGWLVRFIQGEPVMLGTHTRVPVLFLEVEGERAAEAAYFLRQKTMRGGG